MPVQTRLTITLPRKMAARVEAASKAERLPPGRLVQEAVRQYLAAGVAQAIPEEKPTAAELRAFRRGMAEFARGEYEPLDKVLRELHDLDRRRLGKRQKVP